MSDHPVGLVRLVNHPEFHICAEIAYGSVHSDICVTTTDAGVSERDKAYLREAFEEFLANFKPGSGYFHVNGNEAFRYTYD